jgi:ABC-type spermidine/putrescine transport system permease subunit II
MLSRRAFAGNWAFVAVVLALLYLPLVPPLFFSVDPGTGPGAGATLRWYRDMWDNPLLVDGLWVSLLTGLATALLTPALALLSAMAVRELGVPRLVLAMILLPLFIPGVSMGLATSFLFREVGLPPSLWSIGLVQVLWALPFATMIILTVMAGFDPALLEAAYLHGANRWQAFRDVELPLIAPGIVGAASFSMILSFNETVRTSLVQGPFNTVQTYIWSTYRQIGLSPTLYALMSLLVMVTVAVALAGLLGAGKERPS